MYTNFEQDDAGLGCPVPDPPANGSAPEPVVGECTLGGMASYVVNATSADDIAAAVAFAGKYNLRFRVKNSGHDYTGRSTGPGAFSVWTRNMNDAVAIRNFQPEGCSSTTVQPHDVVSAGPGVDVEELFAWGGANAAVTIGGFTTTVGAAGGYTLGGGTGPLGPLYGMAVDNVLQFDVVTADGEKTVANACTNPDLFWAMRGGGGAFAVATRVYLKTYPAFAAVNTIYGQVGCANYDSYSELIARLVELQLPLREAGHMGIWESSGAQLGLALLSILPFSANETVESANETLAMVDSLNTVTGCQSTLKSAQFTGSSSWNDAYQTVIWPTVREGSRVGVNLADFSRLISYDMIESAASRQEMTDYIVNLPADIPFIWQNTIGEATRRVSKSATAVHPAWREAFAFMDVPVFGPWQGITEEQIAVAQEVVTNATEVFGTAAYYNEDYGLEVSWQESMFGGSYERLLAIKKDVDPEGLFNFRMGVGSEDGF
jgi:FAD/FMN-containing dehydrogenase